MTKSTVFAINSVSIFHCRAFSPLCEPCASHRVKGQITACGFVQKRPEVSILTDLRSFRLRKAPLSAFALSPILQYNATFYTAVPQPASHQHFPARNVPCCCDNPAKAFDSSQQMQTASSRSSINSIRKPF